MGNEKFEKHLNAAAEELFYPGRGEFKFWWNGDKFIAAVVALVAKRVRNDGCHLFEDKELKELKKLQKAADRISDPGEDASEADLADFYQLFERWFTRLWD